MVDVPLMMPLAIVPMFRSSRSEDEPMCDSDSGLSRCHRCSQFHYKLRRCSITFRLTSVNPHQRELSPPIVFPISAPTGACWRELCLAALCFQAVGSSWKSRYRNQSMPQLTFNHTHPGTGSATESSVPVIRWQWAPFWCTYWWWTGGHRIIDQRRRHRKSRVSNRPGIDVWLCEQQVTVDVVSCDYILEVICCPGNYGRKTSNGKGPLRWRTTSHYYLVTVELMVQSHY